ncbi:MAG: methyltransferase domain-containing protein [Elusimicrobia bacterium]|nr:methyltransferase domain-containing protein [Elusimicrobiota bacterium]
MLRSLRLAWHRWTVRRKMDRVFGRGADPYRYAASPYETARLDAMEAALSGRRYANALEVGAAEGHFTRRLAALSDKVTALELSPVALARARTATDGMPVRFIEGDARAFDGAGGPFDAVVLGEVLYYLDKPLVQDEFEQSLARMAGWAARGGLLLLAHGFADARERARREYYRSRFEAMGFLLVSERVVSVRDGDITPSCLVSLLERL